MQKSGPGVDRHDHTYGRGLARATCPGLQYDLMYKSLSSKDDSKYKSLSFIKESSKFACHWYTTSGRQKSMIVGLGYHSNRRRRGCGGNKTVGSMYGRPRWAAHWFWQYPQSFGKAFLLRQVCGGSISRLHVHIEGEATPFIAPVHSSLPSGAM